MDNHENFMKGGGYSTLPTTPANAPGTNSIAIHESPPPKGDDSGTASEAENPNRG
jgi:hypothetical protein